MLIDEPRKLPSREMGIDWKEQFILCYSDWYPFRGGSSIHRFHPVSIQLSCSIQFSSILRIHSVCIQFPRSIHFFIQCAQMIYFHSFRPLIVHFPSSFHPFSGFIHFLVQCAQMIHFVHFSSSFRPVFIRFQVSSSFRPKCALIHFSSSSHPVFKFRPISIHFCSFSGFIHFHPIRDLIHFWFIQIRTSLFLIHFLPYVNFHSSCSF